MIKYRAWFFDPYLEWISCQAGNYYCKICSIQQDIHNKSLKMILAYSLRITQRKTWPDERLPLMSGGDISCGQRDAVPTWRDVTHGEN